jgi:hypothetical protein
VCLIQVAFGTEAEKEITCDPRKNDGKKAIKSFQCFNFLYRNNPHNPGYVNIKQWMSACGI